MRRAYAPYSDYQVGAAGLVDDGRLVVGCNVENAAYGVGAVRRVRAGLVAARHRRRPPTHFACVNKDGEVIMPCGRCRQVLFEAGGPALQVLTVSGVRPMSEVLPDAFGPDALDLFDLTAPEVVADPYPFFAEERRLGACRVARAHVDVPHLRPRLRQRRAPRPAAGPDLERPAAGRPARAVQPAAPQPDDGERAAGAHAPAPAGRRRLQPRPRRAAAAAGPRARRALLAEVDPAGFDVIGEYAEPLPVLVIAELLGVPASLAPRLRAWSQAIVRMYEVAPDEAVVDAAVTRRRGVRGHVRDLARSRASDPRDDLVSDLVAAQDGDARLTEDEVVASAVLLLNAGHEASVNVFGNGLVAMLRAGVTPTPEPGAALRRGDAPLRLGAAALRAHRHRAGRVRAT